MIPEIEGGGYHPDEQPVPFREDPQNLFSKKLTALTMVRPAGRLKPHHLCQAGLAREELVPFPVVILRFCDPQIGAIEACASRFVRGSKLAAASPHARLCLAGRKNASVPTQSKAQVRRLTPERVLGA